jgi:beta-barrel assembly-enhancing protease
MKSYFGSFYRPGQSQPIDSTVLVFDKNLSIGYQLSDGPPATMNWLLKDVQSSFDFGRQQTRLRNSRHTGYEIIIEGKDADQFIKDLEIERAKPWHQKSNGKEWIRNSLLVLGILGFLFLVYLLIVPWLSSSLASKVSVKTEEQLGEAVYNAMGLAGQEDTATSIELNAFFAEMDVQTPYQVKISVIRDNLVNAFALPGGRIVVYSALLDKVGSYPELAALLSHEFTHINNKHTTRSIFRKLGSKVFLGLLFGRFGSVTAVLVDHADNLKSQKYSRKLEKEADMMGLDMLIQREIDTRGFEELFTHLKESAPGGSVPEFLASHPDIEKRIAYTREAGKGAIVKENIRLKTIFERIKNKQQ